MTDDAPDTYVSPFVTMYPRGERDVVDCAQLAKFEARPIVPAPERDTTITVEELSA